MILIAIVIDTRNWSLSLILKEICVKISFFLSALAFISRGEEGIRDGDPGFLPIGLSSYKSRLGLHETTSVATASDATNNAVPVGGPACVGGRA